jgi:integrase
MTPSEFAELFIEEEYGILEHRSGDKRPTKSIGDPTLRDIRWAALLLEKVMPAGSPFSCVTKEHCTILDGWFDRLPVTIGKSPSDKKPETTFEMIEQRAIERLEAGELTADQFGLSGPTTNKHWHNIIRMHEHLRSLVPGVDELKIRKFITPENRKAQDARDGLTLEQGVAIFSLPPWTGCLSTRARLETGTKIIHDGLYFVPLLVWYTGARREEICKLQISDIILDASIAHIHIRGDLKTQYSERLVPIHSELLRLGFAKYVEAMTAAGETLLFPELYPAEATKRAVGDVFYKLWWIYIPPLVPSLKRGQAMHSARHTASNALKQAGYGIEARNDLLGHSQNQLGVGAATYPEPLALVIKKEMVEKLLIVTSHLPDCISINLLPDNLRVARPTRKGKQ